MSAGFDFKSERTLRANNGFFSHNVAYYVQIRTQREGEIAEMSESSPFVVVDAGASTNGDFG